jgi:D-sedoheptulose 7-phosphate isomerase
MNWNDAASDYLAVADQVFNDLRPGIETLAAELARRLKAGQKILICGNGGSAADAQHLAAEFINRFFKDREPYAAIALSTDTSVLTSIGNDYGYDQVFEKQVKALGRAGDVLVAISTSGNAANVCRAAEAARKNRLLVVAMTGGSGGRLLPLADHAIHISCTSVTPRIQEGHQMAYHALCQLIEEIMEA